ncbi:hypothetical protein [Streptomyces sp. B15]|uniref:hypothetical protein n=1 Tax=Streptomyces sp. B15 TaxID=1537797 RepID=UPI001B3849EF|nr:hypothetical protein [Streptomyces sp. B15]MBQ1123755.1 hypothetical protein [Streptomyces sp. B15]
MIADAVTSLLGSLVEQFLKPVRKLLADTLLATPDMTSHPDVKRLWRSSLVTATAVYVLFVLIGGITVMGHETVQTRYALKQIAPRLVLGLSAAAASLPVVGKAIELANALSRAIAQTDLSDAGKGLVERAIPFALSGGTAHVTLYMVILELCFLAMVLAVLIGYLLRVGAIALLTVGAPLALACHAHPATEAVAKMWWRALAAALGIQVLQSLVLISSLKLFFAPDSTLLGFPKLNKLGTMLAGIALFWVLFKLPGWCMRAAFRALGLPPPHTPAPVRMARNIAMLMLLHQYAPGLMTRGGARAGGPGGLRPRAGIGPAGGTGRPGGPGPVPPPWGGPPPPGGPGGPRTSPPGGRPRSGPGAGRGSGPGAPGPGSTGHRPGPGTGSGRGPGGSGMNAGAGKAGTGSSAPQVTLQWGTPQRTPPTPSPHTARPTGNPRSAGPSGGGRAGQASSGLAPGAGRAASASGPRGAARPLAGGPTPPTRSPGLSAPPPAPGRSGPQPPATPRSLPPAPPRRALLPGRPIPLRLPLEPPHHQPPQGA